MSAKNISVKVSGNPDSNSGFTPLILINNPQFEIEDKEYGGFDDCSYFFTIKRQKDRTIYKLVKNNVRSHGAIRAGSLVFAFSIPRNYRLDGGYTPYDVLIALKDEFLKSCMTCKDPVRETYEFNSARIDQHVLDEVVKGFTIFELVTPDRIMNPSGPVGYIVKNEDEIVELFKDTFYPEFDQFSEVIVAKAASQPSYTPIANLDVPRKKRYTLIVDGKPVREYSDVNEPISVSSKLPVNFYDNKTETFTIHELQDGQIIPGVNLDEATEQVIVITKGWAIPKEVTIYLQFNPEDAANYFRKHRYLLTLRSAGNQIISIDENLSFKLVGEKIGWLSSIRLSISENNDYNLVNQSIAEDRVIVNVLKKKPAVQQFVSGGNPTHRTPGQPHPGIGGSRNYTVADKLRDAGVTTPVKDFTADNPPQKPAPFHRDHLLVYVSVAFGILLLGGVLGFFIRGWWDSRDKKEDSGVFSKENAEKFLYSADEDLSKLDLDFATVDTIYNTYIASKDIIDSVGSADDKFGNVVRKIAQYYKIVEFLKVQNVDSIKKIADETAMEPISLSHAGILARIKENVDPFVKAEKTITSFSEIEDLYMRKCHDPECNQKFDTQEEVDKHLADVHKKKVCAQCHEYFDNQNDLDKHEAEEHTQQKTAKSKQGGNKKEEESPGAKSTETKFTCEICGENTWFKTQGELDGHMNTKHHVKKER